MNNNYETGLNNPEQNKVTNEQMLGFLKDYVEAVKVWTSEIMSEEVSIGWNKSVIAKEEFKKLYKTLSIEEQDKLDKYLEDRYPASELFYIKRNEDWENKDAV
ncbi:MAG: hypothetical protein L3J07_03875 [Candidatus Magasanikbacteria bacterium]|nr:hypothetical protein [Candidatus Magasanikbacteria bacterium]